MRILLVEDEEKAASFIKKGLELSGFVVDWVATGTEGFDLARENTYNGIVLDRMLPDMDGLQLVRQMRALNMAVPILVLTARGNVEDRVAGLDSGCDDYLAKPFAFDELLARLRAVLRRASRSPIAKLEYAGLTIDPVTRTVAREGKTIELTTKEYALLTMLLRKPGQIFTRAALMNGVWGYDFEGRTNVLDVYMAFLRKKVDRSFHTKLLHTIRGVGYVLRM